MRQALIDMSLKEIFILILAIAFIIFIIQAICKAIANNYVEKNKQDLFNKTRPLSDRCTSAGNKILSEMQTFWSYINQLGLDQEYNCSSSVVSNASNNTIKYLIKYTNIEHDEYSLQRIDYCIDWMQLYEQTTSDMRVLAKGINNELPLFVRMFTSTYKLSYTVCNVSYKMTKFSAPTFVFSYTSPACKSGRTLSIDITPNVLQGIKSEIYAKVNKSGHSRTQRSGMTNDLREAIKHRDNYTCCLCGNSVYNEPNLLLEVDHIIPIAKGGKTEASNLQTLCWRCNRAKSDRI